MDLASIRKLEDLKNSMKPLYEAQTKRVNDAVTAVNTSVLETFNSHFQDAGFTLVRSDSGFTATYGTTTFKLDIDTSQRIGAWAMYQLTPPQTIAKQPTQILLIRKGGPTVSNITYAGNITPLQKAEKEFQDAQKLAEQPLPEFIFQIASQERGKQGRNFDTFAEALKALYP